MGADGLRATGVKPVLTRLLVKPNKSQKTTKDGIMYDLMFFILPIAIWVYGTVMDAADKAEKQRNDSKGKY